MKNQNPTGEKYFLRETVKNLAAYQMRSASVKRVAREGSVQHHLQGEFWLPSWCPNLAQDSSLEILSCLVPKNAPSFQIELDFPLQNCNLPRLLKRAAPGSENNQKHDF